MKIVIEEEGGGGGEKMEDTAFDLESRAGRRKAAGKIEREILKKKDKGEEIKEGT